MIRFYAHNNPLTCADDLIKVCTLTSVYLFYHEHKPLRS